MSRSAEVIEDGLLIFFFFFLKGSVISDPQETFLFCLDFVRLKLGALPVFTTVTVTHRNTLTAAKHTPLELKSN